MEIPAHTEAGPAVQEAVLRFDVDTHQIADQYLGGGCLHDGRE